MHSNDTNKNKVIYPELSYRLTGILFNIHNAFGRYCKEKQYQDIFEEELKRLGIKYEREKKLPISSKIGGNQIDFRLTIKS